METQKMLNRQLKTKFIRAMFRFRKIGASLPTGFCNGEIDGIDLNASELFALKSVADNRSDADNNVCSADMQELLQISRPAISRIMDGLSEKGYIDRVTNPNNRRKLDITLTDKGVGVLALAEKYADNFLTETIEKFGADDMHEFIDMFNCLADIVEGIKIKGLK
jgi:DNA-binding MarR family transcriptional regulator